MHVFLGHSGVCKGGTQQLGPGEQAKQSVRLTWWGIPNPGVL